MKGNIQNSNLVIRNGAYLFIRLLLVLFLSFFATRLALQVLGDEKFGIYNIVGGIIAIFAIVSMPIRDSLQRFFNVEFTRESIKPCVILRTSTRIVRWMIFLITVLYESVGLYLINGVIKYPADEQIVVNIVFQLSIITNVFGFAALPYISLLFAKENMGIPAMCEIACAVFKILMLGLISFVPVNVLVPYAGIYVLMNGMAYVFYQVYCRKYYPDCFSREKQEDKNLRKNMLSFSGWSFVEAVAGIALTYVSNIFINIFGGVLYNTAYGISKQLQDGVVAFASNVIKAADPQITSSTVASNDGYRNQLVWTTSKISFLAVAFMYVVFHFDGMLLLRVWLERVPDHVYEFANLAILGTIFTSISMPYKTLIRATGRVKVYFTTFGFVSLLSMILMAVLLKLGYPAITVMYILMADNVLMFFIGVGYSVKVTSLPLGMSLVSFLPALFAMMVSGGVYYLTKIAIGGGWMGCLLAVATSLMTLAIVGYSVALNKEEKDKIKFVVHKIRDKVNNNRVKNNKEI